MIKPTSRTHRLAVICAAMLLTAGAPAQAQVTRPVAPDSGAMRLLLETVLGSSDPRVARRAGDTTTRVFRLILRLPDSMWWTSHRPEIMQRLHARPLTDQDQRTNELTISSLRVSGDTLIGRFGIGDRQRCPAEPWMGGGTGYEMRTLWIGHGWAKPLVVTTGIGDTRRCR